MSTPSKVGDKTEAVVGYVHTPDFPELLRRINCSLFVSTYQAQRVLFFSPKAEKLSMLMRTFEKPTGIYLDSQSLIICARRQIWICEPTRQPLYTTEDGVPPDICFSPRTSFVTGDAALHEVTKIGNQIIFINSLFSCFSSPDPHQSFTLGWRPQFIKDYAAEDRCHLNGFATDGQHICYATAIAETNEAQGWRKQKVDGGVLIDVRSNEIITRGLSMPHSPRLYAGKLWVLNSGAGELQVVDPQQGTVTTVQRLPGFLRGLTFIKQFAFVGVSQIRESNTFAGLKVQQVFPTLECAIYAIDIISGEIVGFIRFIKGIEELFDIQVLPGYQNPHLVGFEDGTIDRLFVLN